jgi:uncharacterized protein (DUF488 family)
VNRGAARLYHLGDDARTEGWRLFGGAEAVPWRCHRSLIADALLVRGWRVTDLFDAKKASPHELTRFATVRAVEITYPPLNET